jgi:organic hydroperoxide reductase OsmC/OhrA
MSQHKAKIEWKGWTPEYGLGKYSRVHTWSFDGGLSVPASAAPGVVPAPFVDPAGIDPEEAFVAAISSCHMLTYLHVARRAGFQIESYEDEAVGDMAKNDKGIPWVASVTLNPKIVYVGDKRPSHDEEAQLHHKAHEGCYVSQSVKTDVKVAGFE